MNPVPYICSTVNQADTASRQTFSPKTDAYRGRSKGRVGVREKCMQTWLEGDSPPLFVKNHLTTLECALRKSLDLQDPGQVWGSRRQPIVRPQQSPRFLELFTAEQLRRVRNDHIVGVQKHDLSPHMNWHQPCPVKQPKPQIELSLSCKETLKAVFKLLSTSRDNAYVMF